MVKCMKVFARNHSNKAAMFALLAGCLIYSQASDGRGFRMVKLPDRGANWGCGSCHVNQFGGGVRHSFGVDYEELALPAGDFYTAELGRTDSDGDGFSNDDEFNAEPPTEPWNAESHPPEKAHVVEFKRKVVMMWGRLKLSPSVEKWWGGSVWEPSVSPLHSEAKMNTNANSNTNSRIALNATSFYLGSACQIEKIRVLFLSGDNVRSCSIQSV